MENRWTQEQIDEAAKRLRVAYFGKVTDPWEGLTNSSRESWREAVLAAQMPIAPITGTEWRTAIEELHHRNAGYSNLGIANEVIFKRNAPPKPDRWERVADEIFGKGRKSHDDMAMVDRILAIVKEQQ